MKTIKEIIDANNANPKYLTQQENKCHLRLNNSQYNCILKLFDIFTALFTDEIKNHCKEINNTDIKILFFHEGFKRIYLGIDLMKRGYFIESVGMIRTAFELSKTINAMNKGIITPSEFFGEKRCPDFALKTEEEKEKIIEQYQKLIMNKVDNFDDKGVRKSLKQNLRIFKKNMHNSVHRAFNNLIMECDDFVKGNLSLFCPDTKKLDFEFSINYLSFMILMFLRNWKSSEFFLDDGKYTIQNLIDFIQDSYSRMDSQFHKDIIEYIKFKY